MNAKHWSVIAALSFATAAWAIARGRSPASPLDSPAEADAAHVASARFDGDEPGGVDADAPSADDATAETDDVGEAWDSAWCKSLSAANAKVLDRLVRSTPSCAETFKPLSLECSDSPRGGWGLRIDKVSTEAPQDVGAVDGGCEPVAFRVALVHRDIKNDVLSHVSGVIERWSDGGTAVNVSFLNFWGALSLKLRVYDLDGDGDPEAWLAGDGADEGPNRTSSEIFTARGGKIAPFSALAEVDVHDIVDFDRDGVWDIQTSGAYRGLEAESAIGGSFPVSPGFFLLHGRGGGAFSNDDAVARDAAKKGCPDAGVLAALTSEVSNIEATVSRIACARLWGASQDQVQGALRKACKEFTDDHNVEGGCAPAFLKAASITPPFILR